MLPDLFWETDRGCRALLYGERNPPEVVDTCDGLIVERHTLVAPIACTRLDAVAPRLKKAGLDALDRSQQVDLVAGIPGVWMDETWLETAFGKPSEKTRNRRVYLDDRGLKGDLRAAGFVTRDAREVERKKVGLRKARRAKQFSKR